MKQECWVHYESDSIGVTRLKYDHITCCAWPKQSLKGDWFSQRPLFTNLPTSYTGVNANHPIVTHWAIWPELSDAKITSSRFLSNLNSSAVGPIPAADTNLLWGCIKKDIWCKTPNETCGTLMAREELKWYQYCVYFKKYLKYEVKIVP